MHGQNHIKFILVGFKNAKKKPVEFMNSTSSYLHKP